MCKGQVGTRRTLNNLLDNWQTKCGFQEAPIRSKRQRLNGDKKFADMMVPEAFDVAQARKPPQVVTVEQVHKHLHVTQPSGPMGEVIQIEEQPHATTDRARATAASLALPGQDAPGHALPITSNEARPLPDARRRARDRSPNG